MFLLQFYLLQSARIIKIDNQNTNIYALVEIKKGHLFKNNNLINTMKETNL